MPDAERRDERDRAEQVARARDALWGLGENVRRTGRREQTLLEEQVLSLGAECPADLLDLQDEVMRSSRSVLSMLHDCEAALR